MVISHSDRDGLCISTGVRLPHWADAVLIVFGTFSRSTRFISHHKLGVWSIRKSAESAVPQCCTDLAVLQPNMSRSTCAASSSPTLPLRREFRATVCRLFCVGLL